MRLSFPRSLLLLLPLLLTGPLQAEPTYYSCLATHQHRIIPQGGGEPRVLDRQDPATPRFGIDVRNAAIFGSMLEGFGQGELLIRQAGPAGPWTAWWIVRDDRQRRIDMLQLLPPEPPVVLPTFIAIHHDDFYSGFCVDASDSPTALGQSERLGD